MTDPNYKLIYEVRKRGLQAGSLDNLRIQYENAARAKADAEHGEMRSAIAELFGSDDLEFTNICCLADGIEGHVYHPASARKGLGKRKCIFCGCDDFDD